MSEILTLEEFRDMTAGNCGCCQGNAECADVAGSDGCCHDADDRRHGRLSLDEWESGCDCHTLMRHDDALRAALARETERAEKAERERDADKWDRKTWHAYREKVERVFDLFANEVMPIAHVEDHRRDPEVVLPYLEAWFERLQATESERDRLRSQLAALGNDLTLTRGAMAADDARLREAAIRVWGEHVRGCDTPDEMADLIRELRRQLAALSHLGTGAGRRAG